MASRQFYVADVGGSRAVAWSARGWVLCLTAGLLLAACGGGGGGGGGNGGGGTSTGSVAVTVVDEFDGPVLNTSVSVAVGSTTRTGSTGDSGVATVTSVPTGTASVDVTPPTGFVDPPAQSVTVTANQQATTTITLVRTTEPAAGAAQFGQGSADATGQELTFTIDVVVVNDDPDMPGTIDTLTAADFTLQPCTDSDPAVEECLRGPAAQDFGYTVPNPTPANFELIPPMPSNPYAAMLLLDQSGSISESDPSDARLFATKVFMDNLGANDYVAISAFAQTGTNAPAQIPDEPVTRLSGFVQQGGVPALFDAIDELATQEGGLTPLYQALDQEMQFTADNAPAGPRRAVVLFTDGECPSSLGTAACADTRVDQSIALSQSLGVDIFTVGLGPDIDVDVLRDLATGGNGVFLFAENAQQLFPIYRSLGQLLSRALATYRMQFTIRAAEAGVYSGGQTVLGTLTIDTGSNQIDLPIRIFLPTP